MRQCVFKILNRIARLFSSAARRVYVPPIEQRAQPWFAIHGDETLRQEYDLSSNALVLDFGGFKGQWASDIYSRYACKIWIFEPVKNYADAIRRRFSRNEDIQVFDIGLGWKNETIKISHADDASSSFKLGDTAEDVRIVRADDFLREHGVSRIDLVKINIEGAEYALLEHLLDSGWIDRIDELQIQFHDFVDNAEARMRAIQSRLSKTHELTYQYIFVWENWRRKREAANTINATARS